MVKCSGIKEAGGRVEGISDLKSFESFSFPPSIKDGDRTEDTGVAIAGCEGAEVRKESRRRWACWSIIVGVCCCVGGC